MHFSLPKPLHGWREFAGEVGIIVIGVLIALGAEQLVSTAHWRGEVRQFRTAVDRELAYNLAALRYREDQAPCVTRRIAALEQWRDSARAGKPIEPIDEIARPSGYGTARSVWDSRRGDLMGEMPLQATLGYSSLYDQFDNVAVQIKDEREAWRAMSAFNGSTRLNEEDLKRLTELIYRAKGINRVIAADWRQTLRDGSKMGIRPNWGDEAPNIAAPDPQFCRPLLKRAP